jgi:hypothetical protein
MPRLFLYGLTGSLLVSNLRGMAVLNRFPLGILVLWLLLAFYGRFLGCLRSGVVLMVMERCEDFKFVIGECRYFFSGGFANVDPCIDEEEFAGEW